jgi:hypothetical protein
MLRDNPGLAENGAQELGWLLYEFLERVAVDEGTKVDTGCGLGSFDLWAKVGGREYYIEVKPSGNQLRVDEDAARVG